MRGIPAGGLVGTISNSTITNSYAACSVTGSYAGGLVGGMGGTSSITNSYTAGSVTGTYFSGGLVGNKLEGSTVTASYYNSQTSGKSDNDGRGEPKTSSQLVQKATFSGWNFTQGTGDWDISEGISYPYLRALVPASPPAPPAPAGITVAPENLILTYGGLAATLTPSVGPAGTLMPDITWSSSNTSVATVSAGEVTPVSAGDATITASIAGGTISDTATVQVNKRPLTITGSFTVEDRQYDGTVNAVIDTSALMLNGIIGSDTVSLNASAAFDDANVGTDKTVSLTGSTLTGADAANYILDFTGAPTTTAEITKATGLQAPAAPTLQSKTSTSVTLTPNAEQEFSKDNGTTWQTSNVFAGLTPSTEYSFITRIKDDANHEASPASDALTVKADAPPSSDGPSGGSGSSSSRSTSSIGSLEIPSPFVSNPDSGKTLTLGNDFASVTIPSDMLDNIPGIAGKKVEISIDQGDKNSLPDDVKAAIGDRPLISLSLLIDGKQTDWSNPDAPITVSIPYTPTPDELMNPDGIVVWYIDGSGNVVTIPNGHYDAATGTVSFFTTHFSDYAVTYVHKTFSDLDSAEWARKAIETMAAKGITSGTGDGTTFSPGLNITRADFMVLLIKTLGLTAGFTENFDDVKPDAYYYNLVGIAKKLGIAAGSGNNLFKPTESISRQDMMVLAARALKKYQGLEAAETNAVLERFTDRKEVAEYAALSLATLIEAGITGGSGGRLTPRAYTTRAEVAAFLYKIYNKYPKAPTYTDSEFSRLAG